MGLLLAIPLVVPIPWCAAAPVAAAAAAPQEAAERELVAAIVEVSVHPGSAKVTRRAVLPEGGGRFVVRGLSGALQAGSVGIRLDGAEANGVEVRARLVRHAADERVAALQRRVAELQEARQGATDRLALEAAMRARLEALLDQEAAFHARETAAGRTNESAWSANFSWLERELRAARQAERAAQWALEEAVAALEVARGEIGQVERGEAVRLHDVAFDVVALRTGPLALELDYVVSQAGWSPRYDLRADKQLEKVEFIYRAEVSQQTGEDWRDVDLFLSTAEPRRGVVGPRAPTAWLSLLDERRAGRAQGARLRALGYVPQDEKKDKEGAVSSGDDGLAEVRNEGLSVRYRLDRKETIESRAGAATVLVGRAALAVTGERVCTPALDRTVWLRGRTRNTSDYVMLPGPASVFFGNDFLGPAQVELVRPGQEFTLHLGLDAALTVERVHVDDQQGSAGFFGSKRHQSDRWRVTLENHGALSAAPDGGVTVLVREVLPKARDDRIEVELADCKPAPATEPRFARDREEHGILTWAVALRRGEKAQIEWASRIVWPDDFELSRAGGTLHARGAGGGGSLRPIALLLLLLAATFLATAGLVRRRRRAAARNAPSARAGPARIPGAAAMAGAFLLPAAAPGAQQPVESRIERVAVDASGAMVERAVALPGPGAFVVRGLPAEADPASVRVRVANGEVVAVEVRERRERMLPDARVEALRESVRRLSRELAQLEDERAALQSIAAHLAKLLAPAGAPPADAGGDGARPSAEAWATEAAFLRTRLVAQQDAQRGNAAQLDAKQRELEAARAELQRCETPNVVLRDVAIDVVSRGAGPLPCELVYRVGAAGWAPVYELRAAKELTSVEITYRARVWQQTAEDWNDVDLWLSSAQPQLGAQGPDPRAEWLSLRALPSTRGKFFAASEASVESEAADAPAPGFVAARPAPFATVADEGLSVRFHLPDRQRIPSRPDGQVVLVGRARLPLVPERDCVPALDPTVWLTGKATNTSDWILLPGESAVHLGSDYLGRGAIELTQKGKEFTVHLGPDPFVSVERVRLDDQLRTSLFSSKGVAVNTWRMRFENLGAPSTARDGGIVVTVREALPKPRDSRITVRLDSARPEPSRTDEDRKLREEKGTLTWRLPIARAGKAEIEWKWSCRYPESAVLVTTSE